MVTMSSGNHAQALAWAAARFGVPAVVVMPHDAPPNKRAATEGYGAEVVGYDRYREDRDAIAAEVAASRGYGLVPPYDDWDVMAGQGTAALELCEDAGDLDLLVVPVGGGGLVAGCSTVAKAWASAGRRSWGWSRRPATTIAAPVSLGRRDRLDAVPVTIADGQAAVEPGELTWEVNRRRVDAFVTVTRRGDPRRHALRVRAAPHRRRAVRRLRASPRCWAAPPPRRPATSLGAGSAWCSRAATSTPPASPHSSAEAGETIAPRQLLAAIRAVRSPRWEGDGDAV